MRSILGLMIPPPIAILAAFCRSIDSLANPLTRGGSMTATLVRRLLVVGAIVAVPAAGFAQETTLAGTVTDVTGGVLPGVTITVLHEATGNTFEGVTDERGTYRI